MTPERVRHLLQATRSDPSLADAPALLRSLEQAAEERPQDRLLADAVLALHGMVTAGDGLPPVVGGVRRERLVRWDGWSCTWDGTLLREGHPARVRTLRADAARDALLRRALLRDGRALRGVLPVPVAASEGEWPALVVRLPGPPLPPHADPDDREDPAVLVRMLGTGLAAMTRWESGGFGLDAVATAEICDTPDGLAILALTPFDPCDAGPALARLAATLREWWDEGVETPVDELIGALEVFPPHSAAEAFARWRTVLATELSGARHRLSRRATQLQAASRGVRLRDAVERMLAALPPPPGRGAIGVDLDGAVTVVESRDGRVRWGPQTGELVEVYAIGTGFAAAEARRLLRARATAPDNPRLHAQIGGSSAETEAICRWIAAGLGLRTVRKLLEAGGS